METKGLMTATEFAEKINTPYPTVAAWLRDGLVPGAELHTFGKVKFWTIPVDVLKDFVRPKKGRPLGRKTTKKAKKAGK
jgi:hypothetical protein